MNRPRKKFELFELYKHNLKVDEAIYRKWKRGIFYPASKLSKEKLSEITGLIRPSTLVKPEPLPDYYKKVRPEEA